MNESQLKINLEEATFLSMAVLSLLEQVDDSLKNPRYNYTPEAKLGQIEMMMAGQSLRKKLEGIGMDMQDLPPYEEGDEEQFITKEP